MHFQSGEGYVIKNRTSSNQIVKKMESISW